MKSLANCTPSEFFKQTLRIKHNVEKWLTSDDIQEIRKRKPDGLESISNEMTVAEQKALLSRNAKKYEEQSMKNFMDIIEVMLGKKFDETLSVLALCCFVEPEHVDDYVMDDYFEAIADLIANPNVMRFFASLAQLGQTSISIVSKK